MILEFKNPSFKVINPSQILDMLGLDYTDAVQVELYPDGKVIVTCPDAIADDIRDLIEPYKVKDDFKTSQLSNLTQEQLATYIDNNVTTLATAKEYIKKLSAVVLYLVKHTRLDK